MPPPWLALTALPPPPGTTPGGGGCFPLPNGTAMTHSQADVPFVDTSPSDLTFSTATPIQEALAVKQCGPLELRVLGASHQVKVGGLIETLACLPGLSPHLPRHAARPGYAFTSAVYRPDDLPAAVAAIARHVAAHDGLSVTFPGDPHALTALSATAHGGRCAWATWHVYPQGGHVVATRSTFSYSA